MNEQPIESPFSHTPGVVAPPSSRGARRHLGRIISICTLVLVLAIGGFFVLRSLNDPFRKLEAFPVGRYFEDYHPLAGLKFRSDLRVDADLGWKNGTGRLMAFTPSEDSRQLVVFIPPDLSDIFFNKGQTYTVELQVTEGGLLHANACRKN